jgi:Ni/Co efflux regulator RcnB
MNPRKIAATLLALTMTFSGVSFAQGRGHGDERGGKDRGGHGQAGPGHDRRDGRGHDRHDRRDDRGRHGPQARHMERGAGPNHEFHRGSRLPRQYRGRQYVVNDWRGHHLSAPPRGYHWVQNGGDYLLVAITTGVILQLLLNN